MSFVSVKAMRLYKCECILVNGCLQNSVDIEVISFLDPPVTYVCMETSLCFAFEE